MKCVAILTTDIRIMNKIKILIDGLEALHAMNLIKNLLFQRLIQIRLLKSLLKKSSLLMISSLPRNQSHKILINLNLTN